MDNHNAFLFKVGVNKLPIVNIRMIENHPKNKTDTKLRATTTRGEVIISSI